MLCVSTTKKKREFISELHTIIARRHLVPHSVCYVFSIQQNLKFKFLRILLPSIQGLERWVLERGLSFPRKRAIT